MGDHRRSDLRPLLDDDDPAERGLCCAPCRAGVLRQLHDPTGVGYAPVHDVEQVAFLA